MKPAIKIGSLLLAVMMAFSALFASGCSLGKEWSYKTSDTELAIGVYIYELDVAYNQALSKAKELDDYDGTKDTWLDMEITDDDGNKAVAREWIKDTAKKKCLRYLALEKALVDEGATVDSASLESAASEAKTYWDVGQYASMGHVMPMSKELEPHGISYDSFKYCVADYSVKYSTLFAALYEEGGSQEVSDKDIEGFVNDNYVDYSYFSVNLYESTTDEAGESTSVALSEDAVKKIKDELEGYVKQANDGKSAEEIAQDYADANSLEQSPLSGNTENLESFSMGDEMKEAIEKLDNNKATTVQVGEGENAILYFVYKKDIKDASADYVVSNRASVLSDMKSDDFLDYLDDIASKMEYEESSAVNGYDPKMFFVAEEPATTEAAEDETDAEGDAAEEETAAEE